MEEPDTSRVLRGSHDGFVENLMQNAALLRRRIRDPHLRLERIQLPERSATDVALCYMEGKAEERCTFTFTLNAYYSMFSGILRLHDPASLAPPLRL